MGIPRLLRTSGLLAGAVVLLIGAPSQGATAAAPVARPAVAKVCEQLGDCMVRPKQLAFSANNDLIGAQLSWSGWGRSTTTAKGWIRVNWSGTPKLHRGKVKLSGLTRCGGSQYYRKGTVTWPGQTVRVTFDC
jgi:hypothetical protein